MDDEALDAAFAAAMAEFDHALRETDGRAARRAIVRVEGLLGIDEPEPAYMRGVLADREGDLKLARRSLEHAIALDESYADARYALALVHDAQGDFRAMVEQLERVLELDQAVDQAASVGSREQLDAIAETAETVLVNLPQHFRDRLENVPVVLEQRPHVALVREGFDPRALGLFEGLEDGQRDAIQLAPTRIVLFTANLLVSFPSQDELEREIEVTMLHEIGHFFGLDEDEVAQLGLA
jgi:predicted Zn-dependent protease with MMP-like domain